VQIEVDGRVVGTAHDIGMHGGISFAAYNCAAEIFRCDGYRRTRPRPRCPSPRSPSTSLLAQQPGRPSPTCREASTPSSSTRRASVASTRRSRSRSTLLSFPDAPNLSSIVVTDARTGTPLPTQVDESSRYRQDPGPRHARSQILAGAFVPGDRRALLGAPSPAPVHDRERKLRSLRTVLWSPTPPAGGGREEPGLSARSSTIKASSRSARPGSTQVRFLRRPSRRGNARAAPYRAGARAFRNSARCQREGAPDAGHRGLPRPGVHDDHPGRG